MIRERLSEYIEKNSKTKEKIVELYLEKPDGAIFYNSILNWINENSLFLVKRRVIVENRNYLLNRNYVIIQQGSFYRLDFVRKIGYLDVENHYCMDLSLWLDLLDYGNIYSVKTNIPLAAFRMYTGTKTDTGKEMFLNNIKKVLIEKGASKISINIVYRIYIYKIKLKIKELICAM